MVRLVYLLLGADYFRGRWRTLWAIGALWMAAGLALFVDGLDGAIGFPVTAFAVLLGVEGLATLVVSATGVGGQRALRVVKGLASLVAALLVIDASGRHLGNAVLSIVFGVLFLADGLLQCGAAWVVRYRRWRWVFAGGVSQVLLAVFFFQPWPTGYAGTLPYALGLLLFFGGARMILLARHARATREEPAAGALPASARRTYDGPPADHEAALTVHVWTPSGSARSPTRPQPVVDRYIAAVDQSGAISTGHAAMESPEGIYISLYPGVEIDRSPGEFTRVLRATPENDVPGVFQPDYTTESKAWCPSTEQVRIRNYDAAALARFWNAYRRDTTYNLTHRNCSSTVSRALEAALAGTVAARDGTGWGTLLRLLVTPELWVAAQVRRRAVTMAWTPGLTLDYARALSMLADPRRLAWHRLWRLLPGRPG
jgi:hypothetical protein